MNWNKIRLVVNREFLVRVRKKSFLFVTFLTPLFMAAMITVPTLMMFIKSDKERKIEVVDPSGIAQRVLENHDNMVFTFKSQGDLDLYKTTFSNSGLHAVCVVDTLPGHNVEIKLYSTTQIDTEVTNYIRSQLDSEVERNKLASYQIPELQSIIEDVQGSVPVKTLTWTEEGDEKETSMEVFQAISYIGGFLIYMFIFMYGSMVIRGVIEEKNNRIVEVIISSVKPVELMLGKIIGIALVALLQFFLWIALTAIIVLVVMSLIGSGADPTQMAEATQQLRGIAGTVASFDTGDGALLGVANSLSQINFAQFLLSFVLYFIGGYLMYASMFAAVGSVSDAETDTQQFQLPITIPLILGLFIMMNTFQNPDSGLSLWASIIPFTSPMVMLARLPFGEVPLWQLALSIGLLFLTFLVIVRFSAKIYRVGILLYGKKITWKELWKWMRYKTA